MEQENISKIVDKSQNILIVPSFPNEPESLEASRALYQILEKTGKNATIVIDNEIDSSVSKKAIISVDSSEQNIKQIRYEKNGRTIKIVLDFVGEDFNEENINLSNIDNSFDLIITIGVHSLASLESLLEDNFKLFYEKTIINIDNNESNEGYGQINVVIPGKPLSHIIKEKFQEKDIFPEQNTNKAIFWAQVLESIEVDRQSNTTFFFITKDLFDKTQTTPKDLSQIIQYLQGKNSEFSKFVLLWEGHGINGFLYGFPHETLKKIWQEFGGENKGKGLLFSANKAKLKETYNKIISLI